ncbi:MAG: rRNA pseudouridine synthase [Lachnospiraceae bacterium]|nr:rRNA pseudouridine synthase [Lachnospiraceae bacterium]
MEDERVMRLDRFLCETGFGTRSQVKAFLKKGLVTVNGETAKKPEQKIKETEDAVFCNGKRAVYAVFVYLMLHKPAGVVSATEDRRERTVLDLLDTEDRRKVFPVGRLDKDTEGLLLLTDDGELAHRLLSPKKHVDKVYFAEVEGQITEAHADRFQEGLDIGEKELTLPAELEILKSGAVSEVRVTIREGKFHQVKRMFEAVGCRVVYLKRLSMGTLTLDEKLAAGAYRNLTEEEITKLKQLTGLLPVR